MISGTKQKGISAKVAEQQAPEITKAARIGIERAKLTVDVCGLRLTAAVRAGTDSQSEGLPERPATMDPLRSAKIPETKMADNNDSA